MLPHSQAQIAGGNLDQDAFHNLSTASIDKDFAALVPSHGAAKAQELISSCIFNAEQIAGDEPKDWVKE